jgi:hypothetical protein
MRKVYVKKESLYFTPFYKQKYFFIALLVIGTVFLGYQFFYVSQLKVDSFPDISENNPITSSNFPKNDNSKLIEVPVSKHIIR